MVMAPKHEEKAKAHNTDSKKEMIMKSAIRLFLQQGYRNTSLRQIAQASDSSASLSIYHFGTKQAIAVAYISDLILAKRQVTLPANLHTFYSHYIIPGIEFAAWISEPDNPPCDEKLDIPFRTLMGIIYVPKEEVDVYCEQGKALVEQLIQENPHFLEP